ncbi:MAG: DUF6273 domain-containing protein [Roseburia sp.]|nr:DUF6273 domain-containing protein [Roseburia sp.]MCM1279061.1 DUF6273 domain-containing protein [Robinsoniella sp.]
MNAKGSTRKAMRLLSLLLAASLFLGTQGFTVFAETISQNGAAAPESSRTEPESDGKVGDKRIEPESESTGQENGGKGETEADPAYPEDSESANPQQEVLPDSNISENNARVGAGTPANPIHHCTKKNDGTDYTDFSYVYFGSYPQSEVTDSATKAAIDSAVATAGTTADAGMDVWVNGTKYRRISESDTNYRGCFDDVSNNGYRYFKWERIKWKVLQNNGSTLFVVADKAIDCKDYNDKLTSITWEGSTIRNWLNNSFYGTAFSSSEQNAIVTQNVVNEDNPYYYGTEGGNNTNDKIYLLSIGEVTNETYGFCSDYSTYSVSRRMKTSDYANARGASRNSSGAYEGNCWWWLRSPGWDSVIGAYVGVDGYVDRYGRSVHYYGGGVCPALHINLSSGIWSMADDGTSGEGGNGGGDSKGELPNVSVNPDECGILVYDGETNRPIPMATVAVGERQYVTDANGLARVPAGGNGEGIYINYVTAEGYGMQIGGLDKLIPGEVKYFPLYLSNGEDLKLITATAEIGSKIINLLNDKLYLSYNGELISGDTAGAKEMKLILRARGNIAKYDIISNGKVVKTSETGEFTFPVITEQNGTAYQNPLCSQFTPRKDVSVRVTDTAGNTSIQNLGIRVCELGKEIEEVEKTGKVSLGKSISVTLPDDVPFLGGREISYGFEGGLPFDLEVGADGKVKIAVNKKTDQNFERFKEDYDKLSSRAMDLSNAAQSFGGTPQSFGAGYVKVNGSVCGYGEGYFDELDQGKLVINVGVILSVNASAGYTQYFFAGYIPFYVTIEGGIKVSAELKASMLYENGMLDLSGGLGDMTGKVYLTAGAGVGVKDLVNVEVNGTGDVNVLWKPASDYWKVWAGLGMAIHSDLFGWSFDLWESPTKTYTIYESPRTGMGGRSGISARTGTAGIYDTSQYRLIDRSYLDKKQDSSAAEFQRAGAGQQQGTTLSLVEQAVYPSAKPRLIEANGLSYLFWLEDIRERSAENRSALVYAVSADGKSFSQPKRLIPETEDKTADYSFDLQADGENIHIIWQDAETVLESGAGLSDVAENISISYAKLNTATGQVEEKKKLTALPGCYLMPKITVCGQKAYGAWVEADLGSSRNVLDVDNIYTVFCADIQSGDTRQYASMPKEQNIVSMDIGFSGQQGASGSVAFVCEVDEDGDLSTMEDRELYGDTSVDFQNGAGSLERFTNNGVIDSCPSFAPVEGSGCWFWYQNGNIYYTKNPGRSSGISVFAKKPTNLNGSFSIMEENDTVAAIIWEAVDQEEEDGSTSIYAASCREGSWTEQYRLCNTGSAFTSAPNGYCKNGEYFLTYKHSALQQDGSVLCSIYVANQTETIMTSLESVSYDVEQVMPGERLPLSLVVKNQGNTVIDTLEFFSGGNKFSTIIRANLAPGERGVYELSGFTVDSGLSSLTEYPISVRAQGETVDADNEYTINIGYTDLYVKAQTRYFEGADWLDISVLNHSAIPSKGTLTLYADKEQGEILWSQPVDTVTNEEGIGLSISLEEYGKEHCTYYLCIESEEEDGILSNNQELIYTGYGTEIQGGSLVKDPITYMVTFDSNGGSKVESQSIIEGSRAVEPVPPTKEGYRFLGWYAGETSFDFSTVIDRDMTLTAGWTTLEKAAKPNATIPSGSSVAKNTKVSLTCATMGADIYYTTDGTEPTVRSISYTEAITLDRDMTIQAVAVCEGYEISDVAVFSYKIREGSDESGTTGSDEKEEGSGTTGNDEKEEGSGTTGNGEKGEVSTDNRDSIKVSKLSIKAPSKKLAAGKKVKLTLDVTPSNAANKAVSWNTSNKRYATIDKNGKLTLKKAGAGKTVTVTATAGDGSGKKASIKIKIMKHAVKSVKLKAPSKTLKAGKTMTVSATVKTTGKSANKTLKWQSSNTKYATVNKKGKVTAKKAGKGKTVTITATSTDGSNKKAKVKIKIQ